MSLLIQSDPAARDILFGLVAAAGAAEIAATYLGQARDGRRHFAQSAAEAILLERRRDGPQANDRGTKQILAGTVLIGLLVGWMIANVPALRAYANTWWTFAIGASVALAGVGLRSCSIWTLGRHFRREVTIEPDQRLIRTGPYRWIRHPACAGNLLTYGGLGLAYGKLGQRGGCGHHRLHRLSSTDQARGANARAGIRAGVRRVRALDGPPDHALLVGSPALRSTRRFRSIGASLVG